MSSHPSQLLLQEQVLLVVVHSKVSGTYGLVVAEVLRELDSDMESTTDLTSSDLVQLVKHPALESLTVLKLSSTAMLKERLVARSLVESLDQLPSTLRISHGSMQMV